MGDRVPVDDRGLIDRSPHEAPSARDRWLTLWPLFVATAVARICGARLFPTYDDAFITFRYARNLIHGRGFVYHAGDWVLGVTAPLFAALLALFEAIGLDVPSSVVVMNTACDLAVIYVMQRVLAKRAAPPVFVAFALLFAASPMLVRVSVGAMEADVFLLASLVVIALALDGRHGPALALAAVTCWVRPEGVILTGMMSFAVLRGPRRPDTLGWGVLCAAVLLIPAAVIRQVYGSVIPNSIVTKSGMHSSVLAVIEQLVWPERFVKLMLPAVAWGTWRTWKSRSPLLLVVAWGATYVAAYIVRAPAVWSWYAAPAQCMLLLMAAVGFGDLASRVARAHTWAAPTWAVAGGAAVCAMWLAIAAIYAPHTGIRAYGEIRRWAEANRLQHATILAFDIGAVGYYTDARILDAVGLVSRDASQLGSTRALILTNRPDYVMLNAIREHIAIMRDPELASAYEPFIRFPQREGGIDVDPAHQPQTWRQEYVVFKRKPR